MKKPQIIILTLSLLVVVLGIALYFKNTKEVTQNDKIPVEVTQGEKVQTGIVAKENGIQKSAANNDSSLKHVSKAILSDKDKQLVSDAFNGNRFKKSFSDTIKNRKEMIVNQSYMNAVSSFYDSKFGTLQNNIQNLQLPAGTVNISNNWGSLLYKNLEYIQSAKNEKEYYARVHKFINSIYVVPNIAYEFSAGLWKESEDAKNIIVGFTKIMRNGDDVKNYILYVMSIDPYSNNSQAKEYFEENGVNETVRTVEAYLGGI